VLRAQFVNFNFPSKLICAAGSNALWSLGRLIL
jgi:hypothetical protein